MISLPLQRSRHGRSLLRLVWLFMVIVVTSNNGVAEAVTTCPKPTCLYFPFVPVAPPVRVNRFVLLRLRTADHRIIGEVVNTSNQPVYDVVVTATVYHDAAGTLTETITRTTTLPATLPGQLNPFNIIVPYRMSSPDVYNATVVVASWYPTSTLVYRPATIVTSATLSGEGTVVYAEIRNDQVQPLKNVQAVAWAPGSSVGVVTGQVASQLASGETVSFTAGLDSRQLPLSSINVVAQGVISP